MFVLVQNQELPGYQQGLGSLLLGPSFLLPYRDCVCTDANKILAGIHGQTGDTAA